MNLNFAVQLKVQRPVREVFDAVYNPKKLSVYFGRTEHFLDEGKTVVWKHGDDPDHPFEIPVRVEKMVPDQLIRFAWAASEGIYDAKTGQYPKPGGYDTVVEITFESLKPDVTLVKITEGSWRATEGGLQGSYQNCQGWMNMACCLKAFVEHGINLRQGAF